MRMNIPHICNGYNGYPLWTPLINPLTGLTGQIKNDRIKQWMKEREIFKNVRAPKGAYFFDDLVGMRVFTDQGEVVGEVTSITNMPAGDYLVIEKKIYIPFLLEKFVESVDKKEKKIVLTALGTETTK